jgi:hypothetical protein
MEITININNLSELIELIRDLAGKINLPTGPVELAVSPTPAATQPATVQTAPAAQPAPTVTEAPKVKAFWCDSCHRIVNDRANPGVCKCGCTQMHESVNMKAAQEAINRKTAPQAAQPAAPTVQQAAAPQQPTLPTLPTVSKTYTFDDLAAAATKLVRTNPAVRETLKELNSALGIASLKELTPDCFSEYAMKLREMGADI